MSRWLARSPHALRNLDDKLKDIALLKWVSVAQLAPPEDVFNSWRKVEQTILSTLLGHSAGRKSLCALYRDIQKSDVGEWAGKVLDGLEAK